MSLRNVTYEDSTGRRWTSSLPEEAPETEAPMGIPVGPPSTELLDFDPEAFLVRLHNQLHDRGLFSELDIRRQGLVSVQAALQAALRLDVARVMAFYSAPVGGSDTDAE